MITVQLYLYPPSGPHRACNGITLPLHLWTITTRQKCTLLNYCTDGSGNFIPKFRVNLSVPSSMVRNQKKKTIILMDKEVNFLGGRILAPHPPRMGPRGRPETSVRNSHYSLRNNPEQPNSHLLRGVSLRSIMTHDTQGAQTFFQGTAKCIKTALKGITRRHNNCTKTVHF